MINEKIDHHFNELTPIDFNIFDADTLYQKLQKENLDYGKAESLRDYIVGIKGQLESLLNGEDEQLTVIYGFLTPDEQKTYFDFLQEIEQIMVKFLAENRPSHCP